MNNIMSRIRQDIIARCADPRLMDEPHHMTSRGGAESSVYWLKIFLSIMGKKDRALFTRSEEFEKTGHPEKAIEILADRLGKDGIADLQIMKFGLDRFVRFIPVKNTTPAQSIENNLGGNQ